MIALFTDFGADGPYVGQMKAALLRHGAKDVPVVDLLHSATPFDALLNAHLLAALVQDLPIGSVILAVVDAGVGSRREALAIEAEGRWLVGPDNGLLSVAAARRGNSRAWRIAWRPQQLSASFHGRDLFAPIAARLAIGRIEAGMLAPPAAPPVEFGTADLPRIIYVDRYGNAMTGLRADALGAGTAIRVRGRTIARARVFSEVADGSLFWYANSIGLAEIAANRASAAALLDLAPGTAIEVASV